MELKFNIQLFVDTGISGVAPELVMEAWSKDTWEAGLDKSFFKKFMGNNAESIIHVKEELKKDAGDTIHIGLLMPLQGAGIYGDNTLEGNEEEMIYRDFSVKIDQVRNGVRLKGKMEEKRTQINMRKDAKVALSKWMGTHIDKEFFTKLSTNPTADRIIYGGTATSESSIGTTDTFSADLIRKAKLLAQADERTMVKPINVEGIGDTYVMVVDQWQAHALKKDPDWIEAQKFANVRGDKNPIFSGKLGIYDGVIVHQCNRVVNTPTGNSGIPVGHALFLGAQAGIFALGGSPTWEEDVFDYRNKFGVSFGHIFGIEKAQFKYDGINWTDFGVINVLTSTGSGTI